MGTAVEVEPVHVYQRTWQDTVNQANGQGVKYMFCALTDREYTTHRTENGTVGTIAHDEHSTGFTTWHASMHDCITYMAWCIMTGVVQYTPVIYVVTFVPNLYKIFTNMYHSWGKAFNRGFLSLMYQGEPYTLDGTEHGSQKVLRLRVNWLQVLEAYSFGNGYIWNQHVPLHVGTVVHSPAEDPVHAGLTMALYHAGTALARHMPEGVQELLLRYTAQFKVHVKENFEEDGNLGSQNTRDQLVQKIAAANSPPTVHEGGPMEITTEETTAAEMTTTGTA